MKKSRAKTKMQFLRKKSGKSIDRKNRKVVFLNFPI